MKTVYLVKKNPDVSSENNWNIMNGAQFHRFLNTPEGQMRKNSFQKIEALSASDRTIVIEVDMETAKIMDAEKKRAKRIRVRNASIGYEIISYNCIRIGNDELNGEEILGDPEKNVETAALRNMAAEQLHIAIGGLTEEEQTFVYELFFSKPMHSERSYARMIGITRTELQLRKRTVFRKIRQFLENSQIYTST